MRALAVAALWVAAIAVLAGSCAGQAQDPPLECRHEDNRYPWNSIPEHSRSFGTGPYEELCPPVPVPGTIYYHAFSGNTPTGLWTDSKWANGVPELSQYAYVDGISVADTDDLIICTL